MAAVLLAAMSMALAGADPSRDVGAASLVGHQRILSVPGYRAAYYRWGQGSPIVLLHGGGTWSYSWRRNVEDLARSHDVIAIDMIGHGYTERDPGHPERYDLAETTSFIDAVLTGLQAPRATLVGNSWGGGWALAFAEAHPERVDRLVLIGSAGLPRRERIEWELMRLPLVGEIMTWVMGPNDIADGLRTAVYDGRTITRADVDAVWAPMRRGEVRRAQVEMMRQLDWAITAKGLGKITVPTLVVTGEADQYVSVEASRSLCHAIPGSTFSVIPRAGHVAHEDRPDILNPLIASFADRKDVSGTTSCLKPNGSAEQTSHRSALQSPPQFPY